MFQVAVFSWRREEVLFTCSSSSLFCADSCPTLFFSSCRASTSAAWSINSRSYLAWASAASFVWKGDGGSTAKTPLRLMYGKCVWVYSCYSCVGHILVDYLYCEDIFMCKDILAGPHDFIYHLLFRVKAYVCRQGMTWGLGIWLRLR